MRFDTDSGVNIAYELPRLHPDSWFEPPLVIQAIIAQDNLIQIGAFTGVYGGKIGHCKIGRYCSIASGVDIASDQHPTSWLSSSMVQYVPNLHGWGDWLRKNELSYSDPICIFDSNQIVEIGNDVWIGQGVFIRSGVKIGNGAVIAAHSVVVTDVPDYAIVAGVPAKVKKYRFSEEIIDKLLKIKWWEYNILSLQNIDFSNIHKTMEMITIAIDDGFLHKFCPEKYKVDF